MLQYTACLRVVTCFMSFLLFSFKMATLEEDVGQGSPSPNSVDYSSRDRNTVTEGKHSLSLSSTPFLYLCHCIFYYLKSDFYQFIRVDNVTCTIRQV